MLKDVDTLDMPQLRTELRSLQSKYTSMSELLGRCHEALQEVLMLDGYPDPTEETAEVRKRCTAVVDECSRRL